MSKSWWNESKYRNQKIIIDGHEFPSKKEGNRYLELKLLQRAGEISNLELQPKFILQESFKKKGKTYREISYIADFKYIENGQVVVEDVKSEVTKTKVYELKKKMFEYKYPDLTIKEIL